MVIGAMLDRGAARGCLHAGCGAASCSRSARPCGRGSVTAAAPPEGATWISASRAAGRWSARRARGWAAAAPRRWRARA
ncbi:MAG: hypothetical protein MZW92_71645 [Comamonadaceae bacterium]|nr:hypothetical protein [Comamonadaceae bacterium]